MLDRFEAKAEAISFLRKEKGFKTNKEAEAFLKNKIPHESDYQKKIIRFLKKAYPDAFIWKAAAGPYSRGGVPDVCMIVGGIFFGFEIKRPYFGKVSDLQKDVIRKVKRAGGVAAVICFPEEAERIIADEGIYAIHEREDKKNKNITAWYGPPDPVSISFTDHTVPEKVIIN